MPWQPPKPLTIDITPAACVARGAQYLDHTTPRWAERIILSTFNMANPCNCVIGFVDGNYYMGVADRGFVYRWLFTLRFDGPSLAHYGFDISPRVAEQGQDAMRAAYQKLQDAWLVAIRARLAIPSHLDTFRSEGPL